MARLAPIRKALIALFAKSGNVCAFPGCTQELVTPRNLFVGQICHIEAANPGGQRYNQNSTDEQRRSSDNLLLLCYPHHKETDDTCDFDAESLRQIKHQHERANGIKPFKVNEAFIHRLETEMHDYWEDLRNANENLHIAPDFAVKLKAGESVVDTFKEVHKAAARISEILSALSDGDANLNDEIRSYFSSLGYDLTVYDRAAHYENPFFNRNWETHSLAANNALTDLFVTLNQAEVCFLAEYVKTHPNDGAALNQLQAAKADLQEIAVSVGYVD